MDISLTKFNCRENYINQNQPNFGAFRVKNSPEMKMAKQVLKKNCPDYYNDFMNYCHDTLKDTTFFDGMLDIEHGQLVFRLLHAKNFEWPGKEIGGATLNENGFYPRLFRDTQAVEFYNEAGDILRLKKSGENERMVIYTVKDIVDLKNWKWSEKATKRQADLIKMLDDCIQNSLWKKIRIDDQTVVYNPFPSD